MEITETEIENAKAAIASINPSWTDRYNILESAIETNNFISHFPEDMIEGRQSWDDIYEKMQCFKRAFWELFKIFIEYGENTPRN